MPSSFDSVYFHPFLHGTCANCFGFLQQMKGKGGMGSASWAEEFKLWPGKKGIPMLCANRVRRFSVQNRVRRWSAVFLKYPENTCSTTGQNFTLQCGFNSLSGSIRCILGYVGHNSMPICIWEVGTMPFCPNSLLRKSFELHLVFWDSRLL